MKNFGLAFALAALVCALAGAPAAAQQMWVQLAARPSQAQAEEIAADYAQRIDDVAAFRLGASDFYAVAIGPYPPEEATARRRELRAADQIPSDAFVTSGARFQDRFWPADAPETETDATQTQDDTADRAPADQTPQEARRAEQSLSAQARREVQLALAWAGFYQAGIDGAFGPGTRDAMSRWQEARGFEATGVLTVAQRTALIEEYNATLEALGLAVMRDDTAGIELRMPMGRVSFQDYAPPFARYGGDGVAQVLLISQRGDRATLTGLYEVMQTLEIVPREGRRTLEGDAFTLIGRGDDLVSHSEARLEDGVIKGFTLVWPADDEAVRERLVEEMRASFTRLDGLVLEDESGAASGDRDVDLLAGLEIRQPVRTRSGFYVAPDGRVATSADAVTGCGRVTIDDGAARVAATDDDLGLALLAPEATLSPRAHAVFQGGEPRPGMEATLAGYPFGRALALPSLTQGRLVELSGLDGNAALHRFDLDTRESDAGGPILDDAGAVLGVLLPEGARSLPEDVALAADAEALRDFLRRNDITPDAASGRTDPLSRDGMGRHAADLTVRVECWE